MERLDGLPGPQIAILREEMESLVKVMYLLRLDMGEREATARNVLDGRGFCDPSGQPITDQEMLAVAGTLHGWAKIVYTFARVFIHFASLYSFASRDPLDQLTTAERRTIVDHLNGCHEGRLNDKSPFDALAPLLVRVFNNISMNLTCYLAILEAGRSIEPV
ncbi:hypothetical protein OP10G_4323 [Fimbriimonas ginsengisoli Gsoil 348]|uniref:Uncharacterized protein n=2 Tax=Fimbriimonas ginsengisoli TaxID=1005039 RepID=A0A068NW67_FIMGI|nr:hypothetical protein OP10G_4323 [Fimbriimonas ginsengisoli Gsoil 348]